MPVNEWNVFGKEIAKCLDEINTAQIRQEIGKLPRPLKSAIFRALRTECALQAQQSAQKSHNTVMKNTSSGKKRVSNSNERQPVKKSLWSRRK